MVDRRRYEENGYLLGVPILEPPEAARCSALYTKLEAENVDGKRITNRHHDVPELWQLATHPRVLASMRALLGDNLVLLSTGFFAKAPQTHDFVDWHQDTMYWGLEPPLAHTVWIAIEDSDVANGCMRVVPRSHRLGLLPHGTTERSGNLLSQNQAIDPRHFDESTAVDCVLKAGEASIHHGEMIHGSNPNMSSRRRCGITLRFTTPNVCPIMTGEYPFTDCPVLVAGKDIFGHFDYAPKPVS